MPALRITLLASLTGWIAGIVAGMLGGVVIAWLEYGLLAQQVITLERLIALEVRWAFFVAVAILPCSLLVVAPLVFRTLARAAFWHPFMAACVGGGTGVVAFAFWSGMASLLTHPINWWRPGERLHVVTVFGSAALVVGATAGCVAVLAARSYARTWPGSVAPAAPHPVAPAAPHDLPPQVPYDY